MADLHVLRIFPIELCKQCAQESNKHVQTIENCLLLQPNSWQCVNNIVSFCNRIHWRAHLQQTKEKEKCLLVFGSMVIRKEGIL